MIRSKLLAGAVVGSLIVLSMTGCQKQESMFKGQEDTAAGMYADKNALSVSEDNAVNYLLTMVVSIQSLVFEGVLNNGNANSLIVKIENAVKSLEKGNRNAFENQLDAFRNEVYAFAGNGRISEDLGKMLLSRIDGAFILLEGSFRDPQDNHVYPVVLIGDKIWMAENLSTTKFNDGEPIPEVRLAADWAILQTPGFCWVFNNYEVFGKEYGALYNWHAVNTGKLCPAGWHVPDISEWAQLSEVLGGDNFAGGNMKEEGTLHWKDPNTGADNSSGFTALPSGSRAPSGMFYSLRIYTCWWSSTAMDWAPAAYTRFIMNNSAELRISGYTFPHGHSVRCVRY